MPNIMTDFEHLKALDTIKLMDRRQVLTNSAPDGDSRKLSDDALIELLAIARILRTRTVSPKVATAGKRAPAPTLDAL